MFHVSLSFYIVVSCIAKFVYRSVIDWLIIYGFTSRSRIFHLYGDVTIAGEVNNVLNAIIIIIIIKNHTNKNKKHTQRQIYGNMDLQQKRLIDWLIISDLRPTQEYFTYMETSPLPMKGCKI
jgi:hypothetical protein